MGDALADSFRSEIPCDAAMAAILAALAREHPTLLGGSSEDSDADVIVRLRDPRTFGVFAEDALADRRIGPAARGALVEHVFDLLPLPRTEGEVIEVESRAPPRLLSLAASLAESGTLTVLHVMHLVYAVFLDRTLFANVPRSTRSALYRAILAHPEAGENLRTLYACLQLASVAEPEAVAELRWTLRARDLPATLRGSLASLASAEDGGQSVVTRLAQREGLLPSDLPDAHDPAIVANIPRLPERLAAAGRRYLERGFRS